MARLPVKTAADLPRGAEVARHSTTWFKDQPDRVESWTDHDGNWLSNEQVDQLLAAGAHLTRVPVGTPQKRSPC